MERTLLTLGIALVLLGFALIAIASLLSRESEFGGVVLIGPFPIIFGSSARAAALAIAMVLFILLALLLFHILQKPWAS